MGGQKSKRVKQISKDTAVSIHHTCYSLAELCKHLLTTSHQYVCLGKFISDIVEKRTLYITPGLRWHVFYFCEANDRKGAY